jgi:hypothetical protein
MEHRDSSTPHSQGLSNNPSSWSNFRLVTYEQGPDFDDMSSFFSCEIDDAIQYINIGYGAQTPKIVIS